VIKILSNNENEWSRKILKRVVIIFMIVLVVNIATLLTLYHSDKNSKKNANHNANYLWKHANKRSLQTEESLSIIEDGEYGDNSSSSLSFLYYESFPPDTKYQKDETIGMDSNLIDEKCWTMDWQHNNVNTNIKLPLLHEGEESRHEEYETYLREKTMRVASYNPLPSLITMTGNQLIGVRYSHYKDMGPVGFYSMSIWNETMNFSPTPGFGACEICVSPPPSEEISSNNRILPGEGYDYVAFVAYMWGHYGHSTHDNLPWFAYLKEMIVDSSSNNNINDGYNRKVRFLLLENARVKEILEMIDPEFVQDQVIWVKLHDTILIQSDGSSSVTTLSNIELKNNNPRLMDFLRSWLSHRLWKQHPQINNNNKVIIYYNRRNVMNTHGFRYIKRATEREVINTIREKMNQYNRKEKLVIFNGMVDIEEENIYNNNEEDDEDESGRKKKRRSMTVQEQYNLFSRASAIIGPHGSGMSGNMLWTSPTPNSCNERVKVIEFIGDQKTVLQTSPNPHESYVNHWMWLRGWPFEYHHILYEPDSIREALVIDTNNLKDALDDMWRNDVNEEEGSSDQIRMKKIESFNEFLNVVMEQSMTKRIVIIFASSWYEKMITPYLKGISSPGITTSGSDIEFFLVDPAKSSSKDITEACNVLTIPTIQFYEKGKRIQQIQKPEQLLSTLSSIQWITTTNSSSTA